MSNGKHPCPKCGREMELALPPDGTGQRFYQCFNCDRPDPLKSDHLHGWLKGELGPKE
jgi:ssDNA-binding Zn-finger/Zn-ribbon topoisomerase 1